jgi:hypothetical protein
VTEEPTWQDIERERDEPAEIQEVALCGLLSTPPESGQQRRGERFISRKGASVFVKPGEQPRRPSKS